jgi:hypothetical protein
MPIFRVSLLQISLRHSPPRKEFLADTLSNIYVNSARRTYNLYIMYTPYYRTPRLYLSGYQASGHPLPPLKMMEDIVGDYKDKTVTLEEFPFFANHVRMASVHPCKHAPVMKSLLDRADAALRLRREKLRASKKQSLDGKDVEGLTNELGNLDVKGAQEAADKDEWEEVQENEVDDQEVAIRVDQYLVVFLKVSFSPCLFLLWKSLVPLAMISPLLTNCLWKWIVYGQCHAWNRTRFHHGCLSIRVKKQQSTKQTIQSTTAPSKAHLWYATRLSLF